MYINNKYVRNGELELDKLFNIEEVTKIAIFKQNEIQKKIEEINEYMQKYDNPENEPEKKISMNCFNPYECAYWNYCTKGIPKNNVNWCQLGRRILTHVKKMNFLTCFDKNIQSNMLKY